MTIAFWTFGSSCVSSLLSSFLSGRQLWEVRNGPKDSIPAADSQIQIPSWNCRRLSHCRRKWLLTWRQARECRIMRSVCVCVCVWCVCVCTCMCMFAKCSDHPRPLLFIVNINWRVKIRNEAICSRGPLSLALRFPNANMAVMKVVAWYLFSQEWLQAILSRETKIWGILCHTCTKNTFKH